MKLRFLVLFIVFSYTGKAQTWMQRGGGSTVDEGLDITSDALGHTYTTGYFTSTATFEGNVSVSASGLDDIFIAKTDVTGSLQWVKRAGGIAIEKALSISADAVGNTVITGFYYGTAEFDGQPITSSGLQDAFVAKYNTSGALIWVKSIGGAGSDVGNDVTIDNAGNIIVTGEFSGTCSFGSVTLVSMGGSVDVFTAKYDSNGTLLWAKKGSGPSTDRGTSVSSDANGNVYVSGIFSDTITFDLQHNNPMFNALFVIKYNSAGVEQWFRSMGSGTSVSMGGIAVHNNDVNITGNFSGTMYFFGFTGNPSLPGTFSNDLFVCRLDLSGNMIWSHADGSVNAVSARSIAVTSAGEVVVGGNFSCRMSDFSSHYGSGIFCSVGYSDAFVAFYDNSGNWLWARQFGGRQNDQVNGLTVLPNNQVTAAGSYEDIAYATINPSTFIPYGNTNDYNYVNVTNAAYCSDIHYSNFIDYISYGSSDIIINSNIDIARAPFDYFERDGIGCTRPFNDICIGSSLQNLSCVDTISKCGSTTLDVDLNITSDVGPDFTYLWSNGGTTPGISASVSGSYFVKVTSADGCFSNQDTVFYKSNPVPPVPLISDSKNVNTNAAVTQPVVFCLPDSVTLSCSNAGSNTLQWLGAPQGQTSITVSTGGSYFCYLTNQFGCINQNNVEVITGTALPAVQPMMICLSDSDKNDTIELCRGGDFEMYLYDQISNPGGNIKTCFPAMTYANWDTIGTLSFNHHSYCSPNSNNYFTPNNPGTFNYTISAWIVRQNPCDTDSVFCSKSIVVIVHPIPSGNLSLSIVGPQQLCPGDTAMLIASPDSLNLNWSTGSINDTVFVTQPGTYYVSSTQAVTNAFGCSATVSGTADITITSFPSPVVSALPLNALICPNDSVQLTCSGGSSLYWQGPLGNVSAGLNTVYVHAPGTYYAIQSVAQGCDLVSNSIQVVQYNGPSLISLPLPAICLGQPITLVIVSGPGSLIQWQTPLSGANSSQIINSPGTYHCSVTSCGIVTPLNYVVLADSANAQITTQGNLTFCAGDSILLTANAGMASYQWLPFGEATTSIYTALPGTHTLIATSGFGCKDTASVTLVEVPNTLLPPAVTDTMICPGDSVVLSALSSDSVFWSNTPFNNSSFFNGTQYQTPSITAPTTYYLYTKSGQCKSTADSIAIALDENCNTLEFPNVFSPNGDGMNDFFPVATVGYKMDIKILNRWGAVVFEGASVTAGWDGRNKKGTVVPDGTYYYVIYAGFQDGSRKHYKGYVEVMRD